MRITGRAARGPLVATVELSLCHDAASEAADSSKPGFHRQMISIAAAITIPVTNPVKQENSSRSLRTTLMAASPCGPWSILRAQRTPLPWRKSDIVESTANLFQAYFATTLSVSRFVAKTWPAFRSSWQESGGAVPSRGVGAAPVASYSAGCDIAVESESATTGAKFDIAATDQIRPIATTMPIIHASIGIPFTSP